MVRYRAFYPNEMGTKILKTNHGQIRGTWVEGVYYKHCIRIPCPINDSATERDFEHLIFADGVGDWNLPAEIERKVVIGDTVCQKFDYININKRALFEKDLVRFKYMKDDIEYLGVGLVVYIDGKIYIKVPNKLIPFDEVTVTDIVGNSFDYEDVENQIHLNITGFYGEIIGAMWENKDGLTHYIAIKDGVGNVWKFGGLDLINNNCGQYLSLLMRTFNISNVDSSSITGIKIYCAVEDNKVVAIANKIDDGMKIMDLRNIFDDE